MEDLNDVTGSTALRCGSSSTKNKHATIAIAQPSTTVSTQALYGFEGVGIYSDPK